jgi:hypothetical protein
MLDQPPEELGTIAALVFACVLIVLVIIGVVLLIVFFSRTSEAVVEGAAIAAPTTCPSATAPAPVRSE